ncbi:hypothetical protein [Algoriphagus sp.]|uniref:hypothetical protein n=1 Tax=Algoriphagus sp. TaxID=1872435 RepID=UPI002612EEDB|nr:hypothetical protein [Algoriphagus sp.]
MKTSMLIAAMFVSGMALANPATSLNPNTISLEQQEGKVKIEADDLPDPVKTTISNDETINQLSILEAWKWNTPEGKTLFEVVFDNGTEEKFSKKYDEQGNEIKE